MSKIKVDTVTNLAGTGAPNIPDGITIGGVALASVNTQEHYAQSAAPSSPADGAVWYDTDDDKAYVYINSEFYELTYTDLPPGMLGDRAVLSGGYGGSQLDSMEYFSIATTGNATDAGNLSGTRNTHASCSSGSRAVFGGGTNSSLAAINTIEYITIAALGNAQDFGDLPETKDWLAALSSTVRGVFAGGGSSTASRQGMDYITILYSENITIRVQWVFKYSHSIYCLCNNDNS